MTAWWTPGPILIAGPCVLESDDLNLRVATELAGLADRLRVRIMFKASFDKANRSRAAAPRGPGLEAGLRALERVRRETGLPVLTDVHEPHQVPLVAQVVDAIQIPAFLCRQTDLLEAAGRSGRPVNLKKGQWMSPAGMAAAVDKVRRAGAQEVAVTERGTFFGYQDLVVDMRNFGRLRTLANVPVFCDATHAVQQPGQGPDGATGGCRDQVPAILLAAAAAGADGFFVETHPDPARAPSDAATMWPLAELPRLLERAVAVWYAARQAGASD
jgi:2-dehydro-3-deoxyphosphooctonate aldolase (KDO 8-P synthase)